MQLSVPMRAKWGDGGPEAPPKSRRQVLKRVLPGANLRENCNAIREFSARVSLGGDANGGLISAQERIGCALQSYGRGQSWSTAVALDTLARLALTKRFALRLDRSCEFQVCERV